MVEGPKVFHSVFSTILGSYVQVQNFLCVLESTVLHHLLGPETERLSYQPPCWEVGENSHLSVNLPDRKTPPKKMTPPRSSCPQLLGAHSGTDLVGIFLDATLGRKK